MYRRQKSNIQGAKAQFKAPRMNLTPTSNNSTTTIRKPATIIHKTRKHSNQPEDQKENVPRGGEEIINTIASKPSLPARRPLTLPHKPTSTAPSITPSQDVKRQKLSTPEEDNNNRFFEIVWRKQTTKKNKTWDGDGVAILTPTHISLRKDESEGYKEFSKNSKVSKFATDGCFGLGMYEVEVMGEITDGEQILKIRGKSKGDNIPDTTMELSHSPTPLPQASNDLSSVETNITLKKEFKAHNIGKRPLNNINKQFKQVLPGNESIHEKPKLGEPLYDSSLLDSIVMKRDKPDDIDVVVDPFITKKLRPHQVKGVKFLYECVMDLKGFGGNGALLADDMGLGKTLQTITLLWTLLKQSPQGYQTPVVNKVLIACPVTLVANWKREFKKWLPMNRINVLTLNSKNTISRDKQDLKGFARGKVYQVLIMGYEKILNMKAELKETKFDILICDEGHRLKNNSNKTLQALNSLEIEKKILLSGTPIQNDLAEFFNVVDFINPGILGTFNQFKKHFMTPILKSREIGILNDKATQLGEDRSKELIELTKPFILRRTSSILSKHLPTRTDILMFCPPTKAQMELFNTVLGSHRFNSLISATTSPASTLGLITMFKKICNSPSLVSGDKVFSELELGSGSSPQLSSGKLNALVELLHQFKSLNEKVIIVSNYTQTLDIIQSILLTLEHSFSRLDGSTPSKDRDPLVNKFNNTPASTQFAFLLSSKSGGVGLNLIGASRLILFDSDWNPAVDLQAMARIHRDGQTKPVFIYRLITTGTIDERIVMRQLMKGQLSEMFLDDGGDAKDDLFEWRDLKDLFSVKSKQELAGKDKGCVMHELMGCPCDGLGEVIDDDDIEEEEDTQEPTEGGSVNDKRNVWASALMVKTASDLGEEIEKRKSIKKCLVGYRHVHPSNFSKDSSNQVSDLEVVEPDTGDAVIQNILKDEKKRKLTNFVMWKVNKVEL